MLSAWHSFGVEAPRREAEQTAQRAQEPRPVLQEPTYRTKWKPVTDTREGRQVGPAVVSKTTGSSGSSAVEGVKKKEEKKKEEEGPIGMGGIGECK